FRSLEAESAARDRGATVLGRIRGAARRSLPARPWGVGRRHDSRAVAEALERAEVARPGWIYSSASGDAERDAWEARVLTGALGPASLPTVALSPLLGQHAGAGALRVAAAAWTARAGLLPDAAGKEPTRVSGAGMDAVVVIPVADEAATIARVITAARAHAPVVVVDDGSRDGSAEVALGAGAEVLRHPRRLGKAQALLTGVAAARRRGAQAMITLDGDGQHDAASIPQLLAAAQLVERTIIVGSRLDGPGTLPSARRNAVRLASFFASWTCGLPMRDTQSGFRLYPLALFDEVRTRRGGFVFETEILLAAAARGWAVQEVPVAALPRGAERSR